MWLNSIKVVFWNMHVSSAKYRKFGILFNQSTKYYIFTKPLENRISGQSSQKLYLLDPSDLPHGWTPKIPWLTSCLFCLLPISIHPDFPENAKYKYKDSLADLLTFLSGSPLPTSWLSWPVRHWQIDHFPPKKKPRCRAVSSKCTLTTTSRKS